MSKLLSMKVAVLRIVMFMTVPLIVPYSSTPDHWRHLSTYLNQCAVVLFLNETDRAGDSVISYY